MTSLKALKSPATRTIVDQFIKVTRPKTKKIHVAVPAEGVHSTEQKASYVEIVSLSRVIFTDVTTKDILLW